MDVSVNVLTHTFLTSNSSSICATFEYLCKYSWGTNLGPPKACLSSCLGFVTSVSGSVASLHRLSVFVTSASSLVPIELKVYSHLKRTPVMLRLQVPFFGPFFSASFLIFLTYFTSCVNITIGIHLTHFRLSENGVKNVTCKLGVKGRFKFLCITKNLNSSEKTIVAYSFYVRRVMFSLGNCRRDEYSL